MSESKVRGLRASETEQIMAGFPPAAGILFVNRASHIGWPFCFSTNKVEREHICEWTG